MVDDLLSELVAASGTSLRDLVLGPPLPVLEEAIFELGCGAMRLDPAPWSEGVEMGLDEVFQPDAAQASLDPSAQPDDRDFQKFDEGANVQRRERERERVR